MHRRALEAELTGPLSNQLSSLEQLQTEQSRVLESRLAEMRELRRISEQLLEGVLDDPGREEGRGSEGGGKEEQEEEDWETTSAENDDFEVY